MSDSASTNSKKIHYAQLHSCLRTLTNNINQLEAQVKVTCEQTPHIRKMGTLHAAM
ncbi:hypothetical protein BDB01DRAFT_792443 [Pilobolus umbonatus]|nr:hypothetical protein BDB01DRAFT_792443 [Pilobolus umbonatus]